MFQRFQSLTRFSHDWTITEKIDGTNACVLIVPDEGRGAWGNQEYDYAIIDRIAEPGQNSYFVYAQSRNNMIYPGKDNVGFAAWVQANAKTLVGVLGEGRHFGEWCGAGIQRRYGLTEKRFALFNTHRWRDLFYNPLLSGQLTCVPVLEEGYMDNPGDKALGVMKRLKEFGSTFAPGFMNPEGVVMKHNPSGTVFKKTFDYDEQGKWAETQTRKNSS